MLHSHQRIEHRGLHLRGAGERFADAVRVAHIGDPLHGDDVDVKLGHRGLHDALPGHAAAVGDDEDVVGGAWGCSVCTHGRERSGGGRIIASAVGRGRTIRLRLLRCGLVPGGGGGQDLLMNQQSLSLGEEILALVSTPSVTGTEGVLAGLLESRLRGRPAGLSHQVLRVDDSLLLVPNTLGLPVASAVSRPIASAAAGRPIVVLAGHIDTVPRGEAPDPAYEDGRVVGRGACDMKAGVAALLQLAESLDPSAGFAHRVFVFYAGEEGPAAANGLAALLAAHAVAAGRRTRPAARADLRGSRAGLQRVDAPGGHVSRQGLPLRPALDRRTPASPRTARGWRRSWRVPSGRRRSPAWCSASSRSPRACGRERCETSCRGRWR